MPADPIVSRPARIAYLSGEYPKVSHTFIQREVEGLRALGWEIETCTVRRAPAKDVVGPAQKAEEQATFCILETAKKPVHLIGAHLWALVTRRQRWLSAAKLAWKTRPPGGRAHLWQLFYFLEAAVLARHLVKRKVAHLHNHFANSSCSVAMLASEISGIPFSVMFHGPAIFFEPHYWRIDEKIARARFVTCISHFCRSQAMYFSDPAQWGKMRIVHCGVQPAEYDLPRPEAARPPRVIFIGRLDAVKGVPLLLEAFAAVRQGQQDLQLWIVGDGPGRADYEALARNLGVAGAVEFLGYRSMEEVPGLLAQTDLLVLPSFAEGLPVVLMEALAARVPVIASRVAGVQELVEDGGNGFTIPPGDVESLVARMTQLLADPALRAKLGQAGRDKVLAEFDIAQEAAWLGRLFEGSLAGTLPASLRPPREMGGQG